MQINNSFTSHHQSFRDNDPRKNIGVENKENQLGHDLSPKSILSSEEAARAIWKQWMIIRRLVDTNNI